MKARKSHEKPTPIAQIDDELGRGKFSAEEWTRRQEIMARNNALLFYQEQKSKRLRKIKSKAYHRRLKNGSADEAGAALDDPAALQACSPCCLQPLYSLQIAHRACVHGLRRLEDRSSAQVPLGSTAGAA
jgi:Utp14 protein